MTDAYEIIDILLNELSAIKTEKVFSMTPDQVVEHNSEYLQKYVDNGNDYHIHSTNRNLKYLIPLLVEFQRRIEKEQKFRTKDSDSLIKE
jgi:hypothetical protein